MNKIVGTVIFIISTILSLLGVIGTLSSVMDLASNNSDVVQNTLKLTVFLIITYIGWKGLDVGIAKRQSNEV